VDLAESGEVIVAIYNVSGKLVAQVKDTLAAGRGVLMWDCRSVASGIYLVKVQARGMNTQIIRIAVTR
jgi:hypothetical protein